MGDVKKGAQVVSLISIKSNKPFEDSYDIEIKWCWKSMGLNNPVYTTNSYLSLSAEEVGKLLDKYDGGSNTRVTIDDCKYYGSLKEYIPYIGKDTEFIHYLKELYPSSELFPKLFNIKGLTINDLEIVCHRTKNGEHYKVSASTKDIEDNLCEFLFHGDSGIVNEFLHLIIAETSLSVDTPLRFVLDGKVISTTVKEYIPYVNKGNKYTESFSDSTQPEVYDIQNKYIEYIIIEDLDTDYCNVKLDVRDDLKFVGLIFLSYTTRKSKLELKDYLNSVVELVSNEGDIHLYFKHNNKVYITTVRNYVEYIDNIAELINILNKES